MDKETIPVGEIKTIEEAKIDLIIEVENVFKADILEVKDPNNPDITLEYLRKDYVIELINNKLK